MQVFSACREQPLHGDSGHQLVAEFVGPGITPDPVHQTPTDQLAQGALHRGRIGSSDLG